MTPRGNEKQRQDERNEVRFSLSIDEQCDEKTLQQAFAKLSRSHPSLRLLKYERGTAKCVASIDDVREGFGADVRFEAYARPAEAGGTAQKQYLVVQSGITLPEPLRPYVSRMTFDEQHIVYPVTRQA